MSEKEKLIKQDEYDKKFNRVSNIASNCSKIAICWFGGLIIVRIISDYVQYTIPIPALYLTLIGWIPLSIGIVCSVIQSYYLKRLTRIYSYKDL